MYSGSHGIAKRTRAGFCVVGVWGSTGKAGRCGQTWRDRDGRGQSGCGQMWTDVAGIVGEWMNRAAKRDQGIRTKMETLEYPLWRFKPITPIDLKTHLRKFFWKNQGGFWGEGFKFWVALSPDLSIFLDHWRQMHTNRRGLT